MKVGDLRRKVFLSAMSVAEEKDIRTVAVATAHARLILIALAGRRADEDVQLESLEVGTDAAALILGFHPEYLRQILREGAIEARKENGEYRIAVSLLADLVALKIGVEQTRTLPSLGLERGWVTVRPKRKGEKTDAA
jgi:hypothetical protein